MPHDQSLEGSKLHRFSTCVEFFNVNQSKFSVEVKMGSFIITHVIERSASNKYTMKLFEAVKWLIEISLHKKSVEDKSPTYPKDTCHRSSTFIIVGLVTLRFSWMRLPAATYDLFQGLGTTSSSARCGGSSGASSSFSRGSRRTKSTEIEFND